ncbi:MAG TPA: FKBP-type peptidyl-prolyl cis-trans isomerase [Solirubrobacterales bacterium]|jgi:peptidylprolyl isomerase|nr:FKBP-type peptidyl-prolyl cis-trans isomerase [Solirubrobacterales bacterium]
MDRRVIGLLVAGGILAVVVIVILVGRGGGSGGETTSVADPGPKPTVEVPKGPAPTQLVVKDLKTGDGVEAKSGDQVSVQYVGVLYSDGKQFDSSWDRGQPFSFQLGGSQVIPGWDQGVAGMKVGGRRELIIPPDLGYGAQGQPPTIPANATLVFVIDLVSVG